MNFLKILIVLILIVGSSSLVHGISVMGGLQYLTYEEGLQKEIAMNFGGAEKIHVELSGDLPDYKKYATLVDKDPDGGPRSISVKFNFYEPITNPGRYYVAVNSREIVEGGGNIGAVAGMRGMINILVLYDGKYVEWTTNAQTMNVNESGLLRISVHNLGKEKINRVQGTFDVYDPDGNFVRTLKTGTTSVESDVQETIAANFSSQGLTKGIYTYNATLDWDGNISGPKTGSFRVGALEVVLKDHTKEFFIDAITLFELKVESDWNGPISEVYAEIQTPNKRLKTPEINLKKFGKGTLETYWDTKGLEAGTYPATIDLFYVDQKSTYKVDLYVNKTGEGFQPPAKEYFWSNLSTTTLILVIIILILAINFAIFFIRGMKKK